MHNVIRTGREMFIHRLTLVSATVVFLMTSIVTTEPMADPPPIRNQKAWGQFLNTLRQLEPDLPPLDPDRATRRNILELLAGDFPDQFGDFCGPTGMLLPGRDAIVALVSRGEIDAIRYVLRFGHPAGRTFAADALIYLQSEGIELTEADQRVLDNLRQSSSLLIDCQGCFDTELTVGEALEDSRLQPLEARWIRFEERRNSK